MTDMPDQTVTESIVRRERMIVLVGLLAISALA
jgi:hypothetical protein